MKKFLIIFVSLLLSGLIVFGLPKLIGNDNVIEANNKEEALVEQSVLNYAKEEKDYYKIYNKGQLIAYVYDFDLIKALVKNEYKKYESEFPNTELGFDEDVYITTEKTFAEFENVDNKVFEYLRDNKLLGIKTNAIEFSTSQGVFDIIYVEDLEEFTSARYQFLLNFVSEDTIKKLTNGETISSPYDYGTVETNLKIQETITYSETIVAPSEIFTSEAEVYNYLCYGRSTEREYYTTVEGDTLQGVGYKNSYLTPKQIVMLNPDVLSSEDQIIEPGTVLNVTYYKSPLTVVVTKERLAEETISPENPVYVEDETLAAGTTKIKVEEEVGYKNVLYEESWINGVLQTGEVKSQVVTKEPIQGEIYMGTKTKAVNYGTGNFIWPVDNPSITCAWGCYAGHQGTDIQPMYDRFGPIYASDSGVVTTVSYDSISGNYIIIDHQNGFSTYYGHCNAVFVNTGDAVTRGQVIGQVGMSGYATGPHVHFMIYVDGVKVDSCGLMDCTVVPWY